MRKSLYMAMLLFFVINAFAGKVDEQQALLKAKAFLKTANVTTVSKPMRIAFKAAKKGKTTEDPCYYVFNVDNNNGFVVVSADDRTEEILGYVDQGHFDPDNIPENMKSFLKNYEEEMKWLDDNHVTIDRSKLRKAPTTVVEPLITSEWSQSSPYNDLCPFQNGKRSVTGCVATAMAQILFYHKWPQEATTSISGYTCRNGVVVDNLPATTFAWDDMTGIYDGSSSAKSREAVAKLMQYVGASFKMNYSSVASGAASENIPRALQEIFGYSESTRLLYRPNFTISQWDSIITNELTNNRPVYYSGYTAKMEGHAFVCDGRRSDGMFHINWGWGGSYDGYFRLSLLNPTGQGTGGSASGMKFSNTQCIIIGISPNVIDDIYTPENKITVGYMGVKNGRTYTRANTNSDFSNITITVPITADANYSTYYSYIEYGLALYKDGEWVKNLATQSDYILTSLYVNYDEVMKEMSVNFGADLEDGTYQIVPVSKSYDANTWVKAIGSDRNYIEAVVNGNRMNLNIMPNTNFEVTNIVYEGKYLKVNINNPGKEYNGFIYLFSDEYPEMCREYVAIPANSADDFELYVDPDKFSFSLIDIFYLSTDPYKKEFFYSNGKNENASLKKTINLQNCNAEKTYVYGNKVIYSLNIDNVGTGPYHYQIITELVQADNNQVVSRNKTIEDIPAKSSKTMGKEFKLSSSQIGKSYFVRITHYDGKEQVVTTTAPFNVAKGAIYWDADGVISAQPSQTTVTIPENVVAANLRECEADAYVANSNPNTIYLLDKSIPEGLRGHNVVNGSNQTGNITFTDGYGYFIPEDIIVNKNVRYQRTFTQEETNGWGTIALPFAPSTFTYDVDGNVVTIKKNGEENTGSMRIRQLETIDNGQMNFNIVLDLVSNVPYIISVTPDIVGRQVIFEQGKCVLKSSKAITLTYGDYTMNGTTAEQNLNNIFILSGGNKFVYQTNATVIPFRAYMIGQEYPQELNINDQPTSIVLPQTIENQPLSSNSIYTLSGQKVDDDIRRLPRGIYIVNGKKLIVK